MIVYEYGAGCCPLQILCQRLCCQQANAMREFELLGTGEDKPNPLLLERLKACAAVIDALGYKARAARCTAIFV